MQNKKGSWGGKRPGAGRKRKLKIEDRKRIAKNYFKRMQDSRELALNSKPAIRESVIRELMAKFRVTHRMVERVTAEFLPEIRIWAYATKGMESQPLSARKIGKLKRCVRPQ